MVLPRNDADAAKVAERGFWYGDVVLGAPAREGKAKGTKERIDLGEKGDLGGIWVQYV